MTGPVCSVLDSGVRTRRVGPWDMTTTLDYDGQTILFLFSEPEVWGHTDRVKEERSVRPVPLETSF